MDGKLCEESNLRLSQYNILFGIPICIPWNTPIFVSVAIITDNLEIDNNALDDSCESVYDKQVKVKCFGPYKRLYNEIFLIVSYKYKNNLFLWRRVSTSNMYAAIGISNLCWEYKICEIDKTYV